MSLAWKTYRHRLTGRTQRLHPRVAAADPNLVEVADGAKPLAYAPIAKAVIEKAIAAQSESKTEEPADGED